jgi:hypothetical protein
LNRSVAQLVIAQAILLSVSSLMVTSASIIGSHLTDNPVLASLPLAVQFVAVMETTIPATLPLLALAFFTQFWFWSSKRSQLSSSPG